MRELWRISEQEGTGSYQPQQTPRAGSSRGGTTSYGPGVLVTKQSSLLAMERKRLTKKSPKELKIEKNAERQKARDQVMARSLALANHEAQRVLREENAKLQESCQTIAEDGVQIRILSEGYLQEQAASRLRMIQENHRKRWMPWRSVTVAWLAIARILKFQMGWSFGRGLSCF